ncbi:EAL domain-containing response regulator [Vibrio sp. Of7-15]|uniref:EAL domain-containing response regulator n=1 Tax=Vibrio sp. Of7-15 TaxID=2724879 RepID=UPI001EF1AACB|nr:EAL domain-containing response regulator [Vibrio sp. Of7-15]MCG7496678.1 EAL domain-containing response regulator [Vibrio sp. Of7-15]
MKVLVVEDHQFQREVLIKQLSLYPDLDIEGVSNAFDALAFISNNAPDLVICDLNMPEMDGITLLRAISEQDFQGHIVISSAVEVGVLNSVSHMCMAYKLNLLGSLPKPVRKNQLDELFVTLKQSKQENKVRKERESLVFSEQDLKKALANNEFVPFYQPLIDFSTGEWVESEALARWDHPEHGILPPALFIEPLSKYGLITELSKQILLQVAQDLPTLGMRKVAVNLTVQDLADRGFVDFVLSHNISPNLVRFELTESELIDSFGLTLESASRLCMNGFKLGIDDFGTGYSSLAQLDHLPFSELKLDMSFIQSIEHSRSAKAIVESSLFLAKKLDLITVAEGIENQYLWQELKALGADLAQGYFIAKPFSIDDVEDWYHDWQKRSIELSSQ